MTWYNNSWNYRKQITVSNAGSTLTDYQVSITIDTATLVTAGKLLSSCNDIILTSSDGSTLLNYWIESGINTSSTKIWIKIDSIPANSTKTIYMYYGNQTATSTSDGINTFVIFDDFNDGNSTRWTMTSGSFTETGGNITGGSNSDNTGYLTASNSFGPGFWVTFRHNTNDTQSALKIYDSSGNGYSYFSDQWNGNNNIYLQKNDTTIVTGSFDLAKNYHTFDFYNTENNNLNIKIDGSSIGASVTDSTYVSFNRLYIYIYKGAANALYDLVYVRKYTSLEPTYTTFAEQTNQSYTYRLPIVIDNTTNGSTLTNYQVSITVDTSDTNKFHNSAADIRFTSDTSSYNEQLWSVSYPYWIESRTNPATTKIWIKIDSIPANSTKTIYMYYGNQTATSASDITNTMLFGDDFSDGIYTDKWIGAGTTTITETGGKLQVSTATAASYVRSKGDWNWTDRTNIIAEFTISDVVAWDGWGVGLFDTSMIPEPNTDAENAFLLANSTDKYRTFFGATNSGNGSSAASEPLRVKYLYDGTTARVYHNGIAKGTRTWTPPTVELFAFGNLHPATLTVNFKISNIYIRKYASPEPTFSTPVGATSMTIAPSETPCRVGLCTTTVNVTWTSTGALIFDFVPSIKIDGVPIVIVPPLIPVTVGPSRIVTQSFTVSGLGVGTHSICPDPN